MKTRSLATLRRRAGSGAKSRGHSIRWAEPFGRAGGPLSQFGRCRHCGMDVLIAQQPAPNGVEVGGEAVALTCQPIRNPRALLVALEVIAQRGPVPGYTSAGSIMLRLIGSQSIARAAISNATT